MLQRLKQSRFLSFISRLPRGISRFGAAISRGRLALQNRLRLRAKNLDYILLTLPAALPALPETRSWWMQRIRGAAPLSLWDLDRQFQRIAADPRPQGVILKINHLSLSLADLQTLRGSILRLRAAGKRVICFAQYYDVAQYYVASAADEIILQPGGELMTVGLRQEATFLKDALATVGVQFDVVAITPYKGAYDQFSRATISPEGREQLEWLLDSRYGMIVADIAAGRHCSPDEIRALIDTSPHVAESALAAGYVDAVLNEEGFADHLKTKHVVLWKDADKKLLLRPKTHVEKHVAMLRIGGLMMPGESSQPPVDLPIPFIGGERAGDQTVVRQIRSVMRDKQAAAVVLFIDSGGGAVVSAEAMTSALEQLAKTRPLVVYMNGVAASGGYYVATPARWIVAQPGTITGSIGVITAKLVAGGLREKFRVNTLEFLRGANAGIFSDSQPFSEAQRVQMRASIEAVYAQFVGRVARSRSMEPEAVDGVSGGRVWTGIQALDHHLIDQVGDVYAAVAKARELAQLPDDAPVTLVKGKAKALAPQVAVDPAAALNYLLENARQLASGAAQVITPVWWS